MTLEHGRLIDTAKGARRAGLLVPAASRTTGSLDLSIQAYGEASRSTFLSAPDRRRSPNHSNVARDGRVRPRISPGPPVSRPPPAPLGRARPASGCPGGDR